MTESRAFHIGDILTAMTGRLVSPTGIDGMYDILGYLAGEPLMTHQLPRVSREAEPILRAQFPDLAAINIPNTLCSEETVAAWLTQIVAEHGETRDLSPLPADQHENIDPISELRRMRPDMPIVGVVR